MVKNLLLPVGLLLGFYAILFGQELPENELQVNFSYYFDSFDVNVLYPSISLTHKVSETTSITGRYLVDMITAASIRGGSTLSGNNETEGEEEDDVGEHRFDNSMSILNTTNNTNRVDAISAASSRGGGGGGYASLGPSFDDVRNEFNLGLAQILAGNLINVNWIYSNERDYTSDTFAGTFSRQFAMKNTTLELGFVRSWDRVFPVTKDWKRHKNVVTYSANFSQIISKNALIQFLTSYTENNGYLADAYNQVRIDSANTTVLYDPIHPDNRIRRAAATQVKFRLDKTSSMQLGYRYYWDNWEVNSHTISANYMRHLSQYIILGIDWRSYLQSRAYFFKEIYLQPESLMTTDIKLDQGNSQELQLRLSINGGGEQDYLPFLTSEKVQYNINLNIYHRHTRTGYWYNGLKDLVATIFNIGFRYRF